MEVLKAVLLGGFRCYSDGLIISEKTIADIDLDQQLIKVTLQNVFAIIKNTDDSLLVIDQLSRIGSSTLDNALK